MAENIALLTLTATSQGAIKAGENKRIEGDLKFADGIEVHAYQTGVTVPSDPSRPNVITGRATHAVFSVWVPVSSASPKIFAAAANGEVFKTVKLQINKITAQGKPALFYSWELTNAVIVKMQQTAGTPSGAVATGGSLHDLEQIDFVFETITHTNLVANTVATASVVGASK